MTFIYDQLFYLYLWLVKCTTRVRQNHYTIETLKPIFHWKLGLRWLPNANEIDTKNMKCTCPMRLAICVGGARVSDTNRLVSPTRIARVWGLYQREAPTREFRVAVEYRLKPIFDCDAKPFALGTFASPNAKDSTFALPNAKNTSCVG